MKYTLLEQPTIELITGIKYRKIPSFLKETEKDIIEETIITTKILTDGEVLELNQTENIATKTVEFVSNKIKLSYIIDKTISQKLQLTNANYIIKITCAKDFVRQGNIAGWEEVIKNIEVYLKNPKDKETLKIVKETINQITRNKLSENSSLYSYALSNGIQRESSLPYQEKQQNIYTLKRIK